MDPASSNSSVVTSDNDSQYIPVQSNETENAGMLDTPNENIIVLDNITDTLENNHQNSDTAAETLIQENENNETIIRIDNENNEIQNEETSSESNVEDDLRLIEAKNRCPNITMSEIEQLDRWAETQILSMTSMSELFDTVKQRYIQRNASVCNKQFLETRSILSWWESRRNSNRQIFPCPKTNMQL